MKLLYLVQFGQYFSFFGVNFQICILFWVWDFTSCNYIQLANINPKRAKYENIFTPKNHFIHELRRGRRQEKANDQISIVSEVLFRTYLVLTQQLLTRFFSAKSVKVAIHFQCMYSTLCKFDNDTKFYRPPSMSLLSNLL